MAWTDQCKMAFKTTVGARTGERGILKTIRQISRESGIPYSTLKKWYYGKDEEIQDARRSKSGPFLPEALIKSITTRLKAATTILESLDDSALQLPEWKEMQEAFRALDFAISQGRKE